MFCAEAVGHIGPDTSYGPVEFYLDGKRIKNCYFADLKNGVALSYDLDHLELLPNSKERGPAVIHHRGVVEMRLAGKDPVMGASR
jgi:hypothetical protein